MNIYPDSIHFPGKKLLNIEESKENEWLVTNGLGGFSSSTVIGMNTRRYHGLLVASFNPPVQRMVLINSLDETIVTQQSSFELSVHQYPGAYHPHGVDYLQSFEFDYYPIYRYEAGGVTLIRYKILQADGNVQLRLHPAMNCRDYHSLQKASSDINSVYTIENKGRCMRVWPYYQSPGYWVVWSDGLFHEDRYWFYNLEYYQEQKRGLDYAEDTFSAGYIEANLGPEQSLTIVLSAEKETPSDKLINNSGESLSSFYDRKKKLLSSPSLKTLNREHARLIISADDFIVQRKSTGSKTIIAGYPWFSDWGRDTMISLPGLTLSTGRLEDAKSILMTFTKYIDRGMIPNLFPDGGQKPEYNTVDATLWYVIALYKYYEATKDEKFIADTFPKLEEIIKSHYEGTRFGIRVDDDGLLVAGEPGVQLTWMDARIGDWVVTPRQGKPVEVNALWINALFIYDMFAKTLKMESAIKTNAEQIKKRFENEFWNEKRSCLYDVVDKNNKDAMIRPNQIFAISLPFTLLGKGKTKRILSCVEDYLLTDYGLRTLQPGAPDYRPVYKGDQFERDSAYHQGTVWPWLLAPYLSAYISAYGNTPKTRNYVEEKLEPLLTHLAASGMGHISEVLDADEPHNPGGCFAQAWSIASLLELFYKLSIQK